MGNRIARIIAINEENAIIQYGYNKNILNVLRKAKIENRIWSNDVGELLKTRNIEIVNTKQNQYPIIKNQYLLAKY